MIILSESRKSYLNLEEVLSSKGRIKIISLLALEYESNITHIINKTKINHQIVRDHLAFFCNIDFVQEKQFGRIKIYRFKNENVYARALKNLIDFWANPE